MTPDDVGTHRRSNHVSGIARVGGAGRRLGLARGPRPATGFRRRHARPEGGQPKGSAGVYRDKVTPNWFADETKFWYRNDLKGGTKEFVLVDAEKGTRGPAFDHAKLAAALRRRPANEYEADRLPFDDIEFADDAKTVRFDAAGKRWKCDLETYECTESGPSPQEEPRNRTAGQSAGSSEATARRSADAVVAVPGGERRHVRGNRPRRRVDARPSPPNASCRTATRSPDGKWTAVVKDNNVVLRDGDGKETQLSKDGKDGQRLRRCSTWSPDSKTLVAFRIEPGERKEVHLVESSPPGGGRAMLHIAALPAARRQVHRLRAAACSTSPTGKQIKVEVDRIDFGTPAAALDARTAGTSPTRRSTAATSGSGSIEVDAHTGKARNLIDEKTDTFIWTAHTENVGIAAVTWLREDRRDHLRLRARRLAAPVPDRRQDRRGEEPDHQGRVRRPRRSTASTRRSGRSGSAPAARTRTRTRTSSTTTASTSTAPAWSR